MNEFQLEQLSRAINNAETRIKCGIEHRIVFNDLHVDLGSIKDYPDTVFYDE